MAEGWDAYLLPNERILWEGAPLPGIRNRVRLGFLSLFGVPFLGVGLLGTVEGMRQIIWLGQPGIGLFALVFGLVFALLGYTLVIHQWVEAGRAHRTTRYALSNRCAYISRLGHRRSLESYPILPETALELVHADGYDDVWFHSRRERDSDGDRTTTRVGFEGIRDGTQVYRLMRDLQTGQT